MGRRSPHAAGSRDCRSAASGRSPLRRGSGQSIRRRESPKRPEDLSATPTPATWSRCSGLASGPPRRGRRRARHAPRSVAAAREKGHAPVRRGPDARRADRHGERWPRRGHRTARGWADDALPPTGSAIRQTERGRRGTMAVARKAACEQERDRRQRLSATRGVHDRLVMRAPLAGGRGGPARSGRRGGRRPGRPHPGDRAGRPDRRDRGISTKPRPAPGSRGGRRPRRAARPRSAGRAPISRRVRGPRRRTRSPRGRSRARRSRARSSRPRSRRTRRGSCRARRRRGWWRP